MTCVEENPIYEFRESKVITPSQNEFIISREKEGGLERVRVIGKEEGYSMKGARRGIIVQVITRTHWHKGRSKSVV